MEQSYDKALESFERIAAVIGNRNDYVQGGGGNISVKLDDEQMAIKASGIRINQVNRHSGYVIVNYKKMCTRLIQPDIGTVEIEAEATTDQSMENRSSLRPSVEVGFHSLLQKYVIHTHSVYANIIGCSQYGTELFQEIFRNADFLFACLDYCDPGSRLAKEMNALLQAKDEPPCVFFLKNHGIVVTSDDPDDCIRMHEQINNQIKDYFAPLDDFPKTCVVECCDTEYRSGTPYISELVKAGLCIADTIDRYLLYPDQLVYLNSNMINGDIVINPINQEITYRTNYHSAHNIEETLLGYLYVIHTMQQKNLTITSLDASQVDFIMNWESEKYRRKMNK